MTVLTGLPLQDTLASFTSSHYSMSRRPTCVIPTTNTHIFFSLTPMCTPASLQQMSLGVYSERGTMHAWTQWLTTSQKVLKLLSV